MRDSKEVGHEKKANLGIQSYSGWNGVGQTRQKKAEWKMERKLIFTFKRDKREMMAVMGLGDMYHNTGYSFTHGIKSL